MPSGGDIRSLPVTALPIYVKLAWGYKSDIFDFFSDTLLNFSLNSLIKIDVQGRFAKCNLEASWASWGTWERPPSGPAPVGVGTASKMPLRVWLYCRCSRCPAPAIFMCRFLELLAAGSGHSPGFWIPGRQQTWLRTLPTSLSVVPFLTSYGGIIAAGCSETQRE